MTERRVLVVDDDAAIRALLATTLPRDEYEVVQAADGEEALARLAEEAPSLVLLDWRMPGLSGDQVLAELKRRFPEVPVIVLTGEREAERWAERRRLRASLFLSKPFSPLELLAAVERLVSDRGAPPGGG